MEAALQPTPATPRKRGRPAGAQHNVTICLRLPGDALEALKELAKLEHTSVSALLRSGVSAALGNAIGMLVETARNEDRCPRWRLNAVRRVRLIQRAALHLGPHGLQLARAAAHQGVRDAGDRAAVSDS